MDSLQKHLLVEKYKPMCVFLAKKYSYEAYEDLFQIGVEALMKAFKTMQRDIPEKQEFSFLYASVDGAIKKYYFI